MACNYRTDPVCGKELKVSAGGWARSFGGRDYHFCSPTCATVFDAFPATYADRIDQGEPQPGRPRDREARSGRERK